MSLVMEKITKGWYHNPLRRPMFYLPPEKPCTVTALDLINILNCSKTGTAEPKSQPHEPYTWLDFYYVQRTPGFTGQMTISTGSKFLA